MVEKNNINYDGIIMYVQPLGRRSDTTRETHNAYRIIIMDGQPVMTLMIRVGRQRIRETLNAVKPFY